jgi:predicted alpha/beta hydrolase
MNMHAPADYMQQQFYSGGRRLAARLYLTRTPARAVAVLNGATGVPQSYYAAFAQWLAETQNIICMTFDYRDFGASARRDLKTSDATMADWGVHDQQAARDHLSQMFPNLPLWVIGHSLGGLMLAFQRDLDRVDRVITVASGPVNLSDHPFPYRLTALAFWFIVGPLATWLTGYMPGKRLRFGEDIPAGVYWQWRRWCSNRGAFMSDMGDPLPLPDLGGLKAPLKLVAIADDALVPPRCVWRMMEFHQRARKSQLTVVPADYGLDRIGHIAPFASRNRAIWPQLIA